MKLPIAIHYDGEIYTNAELKEALAMDIAKVKKIGEDGDIYSAFLAFAIATCQSIDNVEDENEIKKILKFAPFETVYAIAVWGMAKTRGITKVEGNYKCSCGKYVEHIGEFADDLFELGYDTTEEEYVTVDLPQTVEIKNAKTGEVLESVERMTIKYAILDDLIKAFHRYPDDDAKLQFEVYKNSIVAVNDKEVDAKWRASFGDLVFQKMSFSTINFITKALSQHSFGEVECVCMKCKKRWKTKLDLTNFFDSEVD